MDKPVTEDNRLGELKKGVNEKWQNKKISEVDKIKTVKL